MSEANVILYTIKSLLLMLSRRLRRLRNTVNQTYRRLSLHVNKDTPGIAEDMSGEVAFKVT